MVILAWLFWMSLDRGRTESIVASSSNDMSTALRKWSTTGMPPDHIAARFDSAPNPADRDWLRALQGAGSRVTWSGDVPVSAMAVTALASPKGGYVAVAAAPSGQSVRLYDDIGTLDTAIAGAGGARFLIPSASGVLRSTVGNATASASVPDTVHVRRLLVLGNAGWEAKFVTAALEEDGWKVDAEMSVAPGVNVSQGSLSQIDTSRYSAVVALDESAGRRSGEIARYVTSGGGLILAGNAARLDAFSSLRAGTPGRAEAGSVLAEEPGAITLASLSLVPVTSLREDAVALERRGGTIALAARRQGAGRVLQLGYEDTWRWRMGGGDASPGEHRDWWTHAVSSVAYVSRPSPRSVAQTDDAPRARLIEALGPSSTAKTAGLGTTAGSVPLWLLFGLLAVSLLGEWASRRFRGAR
jgi:hypothetical protein